MRQELDVVMAAVREAAPLLVAEAARPEGPRGSGMKAPVDEEIGALLCQRIGEVYPRDHIVCEEGGGQLGERMRAFHIDPHDGTRDFLNGRRETSISIGLVDDGELLLGVVYAPMTVPHFGGGELLVSWAKGEPLCVNGEPFEPPPSPTELAEGQTVLVSTRVEGERLDQNRACLAPAVVDHCASIATRLALVAIGRADAGFTINHILQSWDYAGAQAILQAAGGDVYDPMGRPIKWSGIKPEDPSLPGFFGARSQPFAAKVAAGMRSLINDK